MFNHLIITPCPYAVLFIIYIFRSKSERRRSFIGNQIDDCKDLSLLFFLLPFQKGYLVNWDIQRQIWDYTFSEEFLNVKPQKTNLIFTEPLFNFNSIQDSLNEIFFEEYKFQSVLRLPASLLSFINYEHHKKDISCAVIVDSGYSFTHIVPIYRGKIVIESVLRIDVGGKLLTNHLKEVVSYRQLNVLDETFVMNQVKEDTCYVSLDFNAELVQCKRARSLHCEYSLPNFSNTRRGYIKDQISKHSTQPTTDEQSLFLGNERISVPELLFNPSYVGINQMGIAEAIVHAISTTPSEMHPHFYSNIVLTGGNCCFPGFKRRVESDVRKLSPDIFDVNVFLPSNPVSFPWQGGTIISSNHKRPEHINAVTASEYKECGHSLGHKRFIESVQWMKT